MACYSSGDNGYEFDFYVCHNEKDKEEAKLILQRLESSEFGQLKGYFDDRDDTLGKSEVGNMERAIAKSKIILLLLSKACLDCRWYELRVHTSLQLSLDDMERRNSIIPIYIGIKKKDSPPALRTIAGIEFKRSGKQFWQRLHHVFRNILSQLESSVSSNPMQSVSTSST